MADSPHTANAAQLASRNIKRAKGAKGKLGNKSGGSLGGSSFSSTPAFASQDASAGSGLFGGGVSAAGTFNFSAPVQGITFGNNSGASTPFFGSDNEQDPRADTTGEEAARRNKPFQMVDGSTSASSQPFPGTFQRTPLSALGQPNGLGSVPNAAKSNPFQAARSESASPAPIFNFGSTSGQGQSSDNVFSLNQPVQASPATETFRFGTPPPVQDQPAKSIFAFGQTSQAQQASTGISFGSTPAPQIAANNPFAFGQTPALQQPSSTSISFSSTSAPAHSTLDFFRQSPAPSPPPMSNAFGQSNQQSTNSTSMFSNLNSQSTNPNDNFGQQNQQPATLSKSIFGESASKPALTNSMFGSASQQNPPTSSLFGSSSQPAAPQTNVFGGHKEQSAPPSKFFGTPKPSSNLFGGQKADNPPKIFEDNTPAVTTAMFGNQTPQSTTSANIFAHLNKPTPDVGNGSSSGLPNPLIGSSQSRGNLFGAIAATSSAPASANSMFNNANKNLAPASPKPAPATLQSISSPFGVSKESESILPSIEVDGTMDKNTFDDSPSHISRPPATSNIFSTIKPIEGPDNSSKSALSGTSPSLSQPTSAQSGTTNIFAQASAAQTESASSKASSDVSASVANGASNRQTKELADLQDYYSETGEVPDSVIEKKCPPHFTGTQRVQFFAAYRLRSLNKGIRLFIEASQMGADFSPAFYRYIARREEIVQACSTGLNNLKRKHEEVENSQSSPNKLPKVHEFAGGEQHQPRKSSPLKTQPVVNNGYPNRSTSPEKENRPELANLRDKSPIKAQPSFTGSTTPKAPPPSKSLFFGQSSPAPPSPSPAGKRKAEVQITKDNPTEEEAASGSQSSKLHAFNGSKTGSVTSSVFKNILDQPSSATTGSPEKKTFSLTKSQSEDKPRFNPFANLPMPPGSPFAAAVTKPTPPSATVSANLHASKLATQTPSVSNTIPGDSTAMGSSVSSPSFGPTSSNLFSPPAQSPSLFAPKQSSTSNLFAQFASSSFSTKSGTVLTEVITSKPSSDPKVPSTFTAQTTATPTDTSSTATSEKSIKPPTFGTAPVNFLAQFDQKSKNSMAEAEAGAMEKAKMEDMDSDEDEAEWEAKYKEKKEAEKKATEELMKNKRASFVPGKGFTFGQAQSASNETQPAPKSLLSQNPGPSSSNINLFAPISRSQASSPGAGSSTGSSIFDGIPPVKPVASFSSGNIFGHLSDADSGADSGKGNEADDDTTDDDSEESNAVEDENNRDATYDPNKEELAAPSTPGTPAEETGPGIASAKKPAAIFNFRAPSNSGTSTPSTSGGSLFDRISKDPSGNPIRQIPGEDKENAGPVTSSIFSGDGTNLFAKYGKKAEADLSKPAQDNTWKQDSPIKFGGSTSAPSVSVTAPTPTKANSFAGLFGSTAPQSASPTPGGSPFSGSIFGNSNAPKTSSLATASASPFSTLFGTSSPAKPASGLFANLSNPDNKPAGVGFNFGAASTTTSSLFPSVAGSATTSRATSPGGTTDGESTNGDPDAEQHEQIDLTTGGPGEENEEVLYQVRAKALKFQPSKEHSKDDEVKSDWVVKGLGPLRVLKNKETGSSRILLRADPSGTIVLNKGILGNVSYTATGKTLKVLTASEGGQGLETWLLQVKTPAGAEELAAALEANKRKS